MRVKLSPGLSIRNPLNPSSPDRLTSESTAAEPVTVTPATEFFWAKLVREGDAVVVADEAN